MAHFSPAAEAIHAALLARLARAGCQHGRFDVSEPGATLSLSGQQPDGRTIFFWEFDQAFQRLVGAWLAEVHDEATAQLTILVDVARATFTHQCTTRQQVTGADRLEQLRTLAHRRAAPRDRTPYGPALAARVADRLDQGAALAYSHRDYCGLGLYRAADGRYCYASVYDGDFDPPSQEFADRAAFVAWLAAQSDYSLAGLDSPDPWVWDNQRLTRQRLLDFVASGAS